MDYYRKDGVRMGFDPYAKGMAEKYGLQGSTDPDGFDPYADTVGPGIYGGRVKRDVDGTVVIGAQYQNHNHLPGPVYDDANGGGYSFMARAVHAGPEAVVAVLADHPDLREEISTGGARPLHICGMSQHGQHSTRALIDAGADVNARYLRVHRVAPHGQQQPADRGRGPGEARGAGSQRENGRGGQHADPDCPSVAGHSISDENAGAGPLRLNIENLN